MKILYLTVKQKLKHLTKQEYTMLYSLCHIAKNLYNVALYSINENYKATGKFLSYEANYHVCKTNENYSLLQTDFGQSILKRVDSNYRAFFELLKKAKNGNYKNTVRIPNYLPKDGITSLTTLVPSRCIKNGILSIPLSKKYKELNNCKKHSDRVSFRILRILLREDIKIKQIDIIPRNNGRFFECVYTIEVPDIQQEKLNQSLALSIDLGINNLCTCVTNTGDSFIIDGKRLKSINQYYNKRISKLQSIKDKQKIKGYTKKMYSITTKRNNRVDYYIHKTCKIIVDYCLNNKIGNIIIGYSDNFQANVNIGSVNNQKFTYIPFGKLRNNLKYLCEIYNIKYYEIEESYTSKASFFDNDNIPIYNADNPKEYTFSGKRVKRGLYCTNKGYLFNADINGALNIMKKCIIKRKLTDIDYNILQCTGYVNEPLRIRLY